MNYRRILNVSNAFFISTGYQIRILDTKTNRYRLSLWSAGYFLLLLVIYIICFEHHFEKSALLKIMRDLSPFLESLIVFQIWLGLKAFIFCIIEWRSLTKVLNGLASLLKLNENENSQSSDRFGEILSYIIFFGSLMVAFCFGLYIAIEMKFELPPVDHIMIALALFIPHYTIAGCLRLHNLTLWLLRQELGKYKEMLMPRPKHDPTTNENVIVDIVNPVLKSKQVDNNSSAVDASVHHPLDIYQNVFNGVQSMAEYLNTTNNVLQRQLLALIALNYNCLLYGIYTKLYFEKSWNVIFIGRMRRIFYAANAAIFVCIALDYFMLITTYLCFQKMKRDFSKEVDDHIVDSKITADKIPILDSIKHLLKEKLNLKLFSLVDFKIWNFVIIQLLVLLSIVCIVFFQYFTDQIAFLTNFVESQNAADDDDF